MMEANPDLSFERAAYGESGGTSEPCASCRGPIGEHYFTLRGQIVCVACKDRVDATIAKSKSAATFGRAALRGGATAFGCGVLYAIFVHITNIQIAFATIGIAVVIGRVLRKATAGVGGRRFQVLAVALTYMAACMGYAPGLIAGVRKGFDQASKKAEAAAVASAEPVSRTPARGPARSDGEADAAAAPPTTSATYAMTKLFFVCLGILLAAPFIEFTEAPIGLLIVAFGLFQAWKQARGAPPTLDGPYRAGAGAR